MSIDVTLPELLAFVYRQEGEAGLREALNQILTYRSSRISYEMLSRMAGELSEIGLNAPATIIKDVAIDAPHEWDLPAPFPLDCTNLIRDWKIEMQKKREAWEQRNSLQQG